MTEKVLIREVLFIFQGIEGKIIKMDATKDGFRLDPKVCYKMSSLELMSIFLLVHIKDFINADSVMIN